MTATLRHRTAGRTLSRLAAGLVLCALLGCGGGEEPAPDRPPEQLAYHDLPMITVNLDEPELTRYIRATITVGVEEEQSGEAKEQLESHGPEIRDALHMFFRTKRLSELRGSANLDRTLLEVRGRINDILPEPYAERVLFKTVAVQ